MYKQAKVDEIRSLFENKRARVDGNKIYIDGKERAVNHNNGCVGYYRNGSQIWLNALLMAYLFFYPDFKGDKRVMMADPLKGLEKDNLYVEPWKSSRKGKVSNRLAVDKETAIELRKKFRNREQVPCTTVSLAIDYGLSRWTVRTALYGGSSDFWKEVDAVEPPIPPNPAPLPKRVTYAGKKLDPNRPKKKYIPKPKVEKPKQVEQIDSVFDLFMKEAKKEINKKKRAKSAAKRAIFKETAYDIDPTLVEELPEI